MIAKSNLQGVTNIIIFEIKEAIVKITNKTNLNFLNLVNFDVVKMMYFCRQK